jgi:four helix bundle protein
MRPHKNLKAWQEAIALVKVVYTLTKGFPEDEKFGLVSQFRRAAVSVSLNIAEGAGRVGSKEYCHFLSIALGSLSELDTLSVISFELNLIDLNVYKDLEAKIEQVTALTNGLYKFQKTSHS